jgi:hypothetical protein
VLDAKHVAGAEQRCGSRGRFVRELELGLSTGLRRHRA